MNHGRLVTTAAMVGAAWLALAPARAETVLNIGMQAQDMQALDPHKASTTPDKAIVGWMFNGLVRFKPGSMNPDTIEPDLAQSWDTSPDLNTWTFHLRHGVQCNNGYGELTSDDVVFSLDRSRDPEEHGGFGQRHEPLEDAFPDDGKLSRSQERSSSLIPELFREGVHAEHCGIQ